MTSPSIQNVLGLFDPEFRTAIVLAQAAAKKVGSREISPPHLIVGMLAEPSGLASRLLAAVDADIDTLSTELRVLLGPINPSPDRPWLGRDAGEAIRAAQRRTFTGESTNTAHLLMALTTPFSGKGRAALKRAGVTKRAIKLAYKSGRMDATSGLDAVAIEWVWDYLPQSGRLRMAGQEAQAAGDLQRAISLYEDALAAAKADDLAPGALGDIYPRLIQANLLAGHLDAAIHWLDEADEYVTNYRFRPFPTPPGVSGFREFLSGLEEAIATHVQDLRLQLLKDRAQIYLGQDQFGLLEATARKLIDAAEELDHATGVAAGRNLLGLALAYRGGADDEAARNVEASLEPTEVIEPVDVANRTYSLATLAQLRGDPSNALQLATRAEALYRELGLQRSVIVTQLARAEALLASGEAMPSRLLAEAGALDRDGKAGLLAWAWRLAAQSRRSTDASEALSLIDRAVSTSRRHDLTLELTRCRLEHGRILLEVEDLAGGRAAFEEALRLSEASNVRFAEEARRELEALGPELP